MRKRIIRFLIKLLDRGNVETFQGIDDEAIGNWLAEQTAQQGFRDYVRKRDLQILKAFGNLLDRDSYILLVGQRLELLRLFHQAEESYQKTKDKGREKFKKLKKK